MYIDTKHSHSISEEDITKVTKLCFESREAEDSNIDFEAIIRGYANRNNCWLVTINDVKKLIGCCFILDVQDSNYINKHNTELKNIINTEYSNHKIFTPALIFIHPDYRNLGYGRSLKSAYRAKAKELGYTHILAFLYFNEKIYNFYRHLSSDLEKYKTGLLDKDKKDICIIPM